jgi:H+/Cl- antiporter ClcA
MLKRDRYTPSELNARLRFIVGLVLAGILALTMGFMLFGLLFVYQGSELSPVDSEFFKLMSPVVMFLTGTLSGVMIASSNKPDANGNGIPDEEEQDVPDTETETL